jgi:ribosome-binding protein aMBF1 (putative translation factor)
MKPFKQILTDELPKYRFKSVLSKKLGVSPQLLQKYINGDSEPDYTEAIRMLKELGISTLNYREI